MTLRIRSIPGIFSEETDRNIVLYPAGLWKGAAGFFCTTVLKLQPEMRVGEVGNHPALGGTHDKAVF